MLRKILFSFSLLVLTGFSLKAQTYSIENEGTHTTCSGTFNDGNGQYSNNSDYTITFCSGSAAHILLDFTQFNTEAGYDHLLVFDGPTTGSPQVDAITGVVGAFQYESSSSCITLQFTSDFSGTAAGWTAGISCPIPCTPPTAVGVPTNQSSPIMVCLNENINFSGTGSSAAAGFNITSYTWDFDDGNTATGSTTSHSYPDAGEYIVQLEVEDDNNCTNTIPIDLVVQVGTEPTFVGTTPNQTVCVGENVCLDGVINPTPWVEIPTTTVAGTTVLPDGSGTCYDAPLIFTEFAPGQTITNGNQVDDVFGNLEHTWAGDLTITLVCPDGSEVGLFNSDGTWNTTNISSEDFGNPGGGVGFDYVWTNGGQTMDAWSAANPNITIAAGTYASEEPFANLVGCPLNGTWSLKICDTHSVDDGTVFSWGIDFDPSLYAALSGFTPTYPTNSTGTTWTGDNGAANGAITSISGDGNQVCVTPTAVGDLDYTFTGTDEYGCTYDTTITVTATVGAIADANVDIEYCSGASGNIGVAPVGGVTYLWSPTTGLSSSTASNPTVTLTNGTGSPITTEYYVTASAGSCSTTDTVQVTVNPQPTAGFAQPTPQCLDGNSFTFTNTGTSGATYDWDFGDGGTSTAEDPTHPYTTANTFTVTQIVTMGTCADTTDLDVVVNPMPTPTATADSVVCNGDDDGSATVTGITGGTSAFPGGYGYSWAPGGQTTQTTTSTLPGSPAGTTYTVTVTDLATGCTGDTTAIVYEPPVLDVTITPAPPACIGQTGSATANPTGGTGSYTYLWAPSGQTTQTATGLTTGIQYTVTVDDHNGCQTTENVTIANGTTLTAGFNIPDSSQCFDVNSYVLTNTGTNGVTYDWDFGDTGTSTAEDPTHAYATPGTYTITQIVSQGTCADTIQQVVTVDPMPIPFATADSVLCNGDATGSAIVDSTTNAAGPFSYAWAPGGSTSVNPTGLTAGGYTVTVTDDNTTCTGSVAVTVFEPPLLAINPEAHNDPNCNGDANGDATASPTGGTTPYTYSWAPGGQTTATATGLIAGTYTCTITDDNGCQVTSTSILTDPAGLVLSTGSAQANCGANDGTATVTVVSGGSGTFSYLWDAAAGAQTTATAGSLLANTYTVTVTDDVTGCTKDTTVTVSSTAGFTVAAVLIQDVQCKGGNDGMAYPDITGGLAPYTFSWNTTPVAQTDSILTAGVGTYTITVTDANLCTGSDAITIAEPTPVVASITGSNDVSCFGLTDGDATAGGAGGTGGTFTYLWDPTGQTTQTATNLDDGTYTVIVTDSNSCVDSIDVVIGDGIVVTAGYTIDDDQQCLTGNSFGFTNTGSTGGVTTFEWDFGDASAPSLQESPNYTYADSGTYVVEQIVYSGVCSDTITQTVTVDPMPIPFATADSVNCFGEATGTIVLDSITNSIGGYDYLWDAAAGGQTTANATNLIAGTYTLTVTDQNTLCTGDVTVTVEEPLAVIATITANADESCLGAANGSATVAGSQGTGAYTYLWSPGGQTTATVTGLAANTYTAYVYDENLCVDSVDVIINSGASLTSTITGTNVTCFGLSNGTIDFDVNGAPGAITYAWTPSGSVSEDPVGLPAGFHYVTATSGGCSVLDTIKLTEPTQLVAVEDSITDAACAGNNDGFAYGSASGGTTPYTYLWDAAAGGQTTATATSLLAGNYTLTVTDSNNCQATEPFVIGEPAPLDANTGSFNAYCSVDQGATWVQPTNGTAPYTFTWDSAGTILSTGVMNGNSDTLSGLFPGDYNVGLVDANGCKFGPVVVTVNPDPAGIASISAQTDVNCFGEANATATVSVGGAFPPFTYLWDAAAGNQTTNPATNLAVGIYDVDVTDSTGCVMSTTVDIKGPDTLTLGFTVLEKICFNSCDAEVTAHAGGGVTPYTYVWNDPSTQIDSTATGLCPGAVTVTITDNKNCTITDSVLINNPPKMVLASVTDSSSCNQSDGGAYVNVVANGTAPFTYEWSDAGGTVISTDSNLTNVFAGTYYGTVYDSIGCSVVDTVIIPNASGPTLDSTTFSNVLCFGQNNGYAEVYVSGGATPYTYLWDDGAGQTTPAATNLIAGTYNVTATDTNGCEVTDIVNITEPDELLLTSGGVNPACTDSADGSVWVNAQGGTIPYAYSWNSTPLQLNDTAYNLPAVPGGYTVTVTDTNNCTNTANVVLTDPALFTIDVTGTDVSCFGGNNGTATVSLNNGLAPVTYLWDDALAQTSMSATGLIANTYNVIATDSNNCVANGSIVIDEPTLLVITEDTVGNVTCNGLTDGFAIVDVVGGSGAYSFEWTSGVTVVDTVQNPIGLAAGLYNVTVTDTAGCTDQIAIEVTEPDALGGNVIANDAQCFGQNSGFAYAEISGGTLPYTYQWDDLGLQQTDTAFTLLAGTYSVDVLDSNNCPLTISDVIIGQPDSIALTPSTVSSKCGLANGTASVSVAGGSGTFNYIWNDPSTQGNAVATGLFAGPYQVIVTDGNGCQDSVIANVIDFGSPTVVIDSITNVSCFGVTDGLAYASVSGGTAPYQYIWDNLDADTLLTADNLGVGDYTVTVTDSNECIASADTTISENSSVSVVISSSQDVSCNGGSDGYAIATGAGGTGAATLTYSWNTVPAQLLDSASNLIAGTYLVTATDLNNCTDTASIVITEPDALVIVLDSLKDLTCYQSNDGYLDFSADGGTLPYTWNSNVVGGPTLSGLAMGDYYMVVTDDKGCTDSTYHSITEPAELIIAEVTTASTCGNFNGSAEVTSVTGGTGPYFYNWNDPQNQQTALADTLLANTYTVIVTDVNGCSIDTTVIVVDTPGPVFDSVVVVDPLCYGGVDGSAEVFVSGNGPLTYAWTPTGQATAQASGLSAGTYSVLVEDINSCPINVGGIIVNQPDSLTANITMPSTACFGEEIQLYGVGGGGTTFPAPQDPYDIIWLAPFNTTGVGPFFDTVLTNFTYNIVVQDANGCIQPWSEEIIAGAPLTISALGAMPCLGDTANVSATAGGGLVGGTYEYTWMIYDSLTGTTTTPAGIVNPTSGSNVNVYATDTTDYIVTVDDGCSRPATAGLTVNVLDTTVISMTVSDAGCPIPDYWSMGLEIEVLSGDTTNTYSWLFGDSQGMTSMNDSVSHNYYNSGTYDVQVDVVSSNGCPSTFTYIDAVTIYQVPVADFEQDPFVVTMLDPIYDFSDLSSSDVNSWNWDFGDLTTDLVSQNPTHTYQDTGFYPVTLIVTNGLCEDTVTKIVQVKPDFLFLIPNTFTPQADGLNEIFMPGTMIGVSEDDYNFHIFDRWGEQIYEGHDIEDGWDGTFKGSMSQTGVYVWLIKLKGIDGLSREYRGHVNLLR